MTTEIEKAVTNNRTSSVGMRTPGIRIFGIIIGNKVDFASLIAFIFSVAALTPQVIGWFKGPTITLLRPPQVIISAQKTNSGKRQFVRIGARMSYINDGEKGYNAIILYERVNFELGNTLYSQIAHHYGKFQLAKDLTFSLADEIDAAPIMIEGGNSLANHESYFAPYHECDNHLYKECPALTRVLFWEDFLHQIENVSNQQPKNISFTFAPISYDHKHEPIPTTCRVAIDEFALRRLRQFNFAAFNCLAS